MKTLSIIALFLTINFVAFSKNDNNKSESLNQKATICGQVLDKITGEALTGVAVKVDGTDDVVYTDFDGKFSINNMTPGTYNLSVNYISYQNSLLKNINAESSVNTLKVELESVAVK